MSASFIEHHELVHPSVPEGAEGFTILHVTDFHVRYALRGGRGRGWRRHGWFEQLLRDVASVEVDLVALTGDYIDRPAHEGLGIELIGELSKVWRVKAGGAALGVFGNHDTPAFRRMARARADEHGMRWIGGCEVVSVGAEGRAIGVFGMDHPEDALAASAALGSDGTRPLITLAHEPTVLIPAARLGLPIVLCGHTHGGQVRLPGGFAPHTSSDTPGNLAAGVVRLGGTVCAISRGVGDGVVEGLRVNCGRQVVVYSLRRGGMMGGGDGEFAEAGRVVGW